MIAEKNNSPDINGDWGRGEMAIMEISKISVPGSNPGVPAVNIKRSETYG